MVGNQLSVSVLTREKSTNHCQTWTWLTCQTFFEMLKIPTLLTKTWETLKTPKSEIEVRKTSFFFTKFSTLWLPAVQVFNGGIYGGIFEEKPSTSLHPFGRWGCHLGKFSEWESGEAATTSWNLCISCVCVYVYLYIYICVYIYIYIRTHHMKVPKNMYISDIRFLLLAATSANLRSWICCLFFQSFHAQKRGKT